MIDKIIGIYKITNPKGRIYIGKSTNINKRKKRYERLDCTSQIRLFRSLEKYGWDKHKFEIINQCGESELDKLEIYYIELFQCFDSEFGLNLKSGGQGGSHSEETKIKIGLSNKGRKNTIEQNLNISNGKKGKKCSVEAVKNQVESRRGYKHSQLTKDKIGSANKGKVRPNISKALRNRPKISEETREKMRASHIGHKSSVKQLEALKKGRKYWKRSPKGIPFIEPKDRNLENLKRIYFNNGKGYE